MYTAPGEVKISELQITNRTSMSTWETTWKKKSIIKSLYIFLASEGRRDGGYGTPFTKLARGTSGGDGGADSTL